MSLLEVNPEWTWLDASEVRQRDYFIHVQRPEASGESCNPLTSMLAFRHNAVHKVARGK